MMTIILIVLAIVSLIYFLKDLDIVKIFIASRNKDRAYYFLELGIEKIYRIQMKAWEKIKNNDLETDKRLREDLIYALDASKENLDSLLRDLAKIGYKLTDEETRQIEKLNSNFNIMLEVLKN